MRRRLSVLLLLALLCGLTACGNGGEPVSQTEEDQENVSAAGINTLVEEPNGDTADLTFMWWGSEVRGERTQAAFDLYSEINTGVNVEMEAVGWPDYWNQLDARNDSDSLSDFVQIDYAFLERSVSKGMLVELTPYLADGTLDLSGVDPGLISAGSVNGRIYAVCAGVNAPALMYNKTLIDELGIQIKDQMTLEEFFEVARQVYEKSGVKTDVAYGAVNNYLPYVLRAHDITKLFNNTSLNVSSAADFEEFYEIYETGVKEGWIIGNDVHKDLTDAFVEENPMVIYTTPDTQSWCAFFWSNQLTALKDAAPEDMEIGITTWPSADPAKSDYLKPAQFLAVTTDAGEDEAAAVRAINYLLNSLPANEVMLGERGVPPVMPVAEAISPLMDENGQTITAYINDVVAPNSSNISPSDPDKGAKVYECADDLVRKVLDGELTAAEAAQELYEKGNQIMAEQ